MTTAVYENNMRGVLYKNRMKTEAKHPNARGRAKIDGVWHWISSWTQFQRTTGERYQSLSFTKMSDEDILKYEPIDAKQNNIEQPKPQNSNTSNQPMEDIDDDIPF